MVVDTVIPEEGFVTIAPEEVLGADVLIWVLWLLLDGGVMGDVLPVLSPEVVGVDGGDDQGGDDNVDRELAPKFGSLSSVVLGGCTFLDEGIFGGGFGPRGGGVCAASGVAEEGSWLVRAEGRAEEYCASGGGDHCCG